MRKYNAQPAALQKRTAMRTDFFLHWQLQNHLTGQNQGVSDMKESTAGPSDFAVSVLGESAVAVTFGNTIDLETHRKVMDFRERLLEHPFPGMLSIVPAYASVTVFFDPVHVSRAIRIQGSDPAALSPAGAACNILDKILKTSNLSSSATAVQEPEPVEIPVRYDGPDLPEVAELLNLPASEVIRLHTGTVYTVFMIGFLPGFPYLGPLPAALELPRRDVPRLRVPAGSVAIAGRQTGIYPRASPGGWRLIGSTDFRLFDPAERPPARLQAGMQVRFRET